MLFQWIDKLCGINRGNLTADEFAECYRRIKKFDDDMRKLQDALRDLNALADELILEDAARFNADPTNYPGFPWLAPPVLAGAS